MAHCSLFLMTNTFLEQADYKCYSSPIDRIKPVFFIFFFRTDKVILYKYENPSDKRKYELVASSYRQKYRFGLLKSVNFCPQFELTGRMSVRVMFDELLELRYWRLEAKNKKWKHDYIIKVLVIYYNVCLIRPVTISTLQYKVLTSNK